MTLFFSKRTVATAGLPWLALLLFVIFAIAVLLPIQPNDYWWYVRLGQDIQQNLSIPTVDSYSHTRAGQPIVYHSWLSALLFALFQQIGGNTLTVLARAILLLLFYLSIWFTCRLAGAGPRLAALVTLLAALAGSNNWAMRPQLFSYPLFGLSLYLLWQWQGGKEAKSIWLLPLIVFFWVNLHGAYALIFLLAGAALVGGGGNRRRLALVIGAMGVASLLNPRLGGAWSYVLTLLTDAPSQQLGAEWSPPTPQTWQGTLFFAWLLLMIPLAAYSPARLLWTQWLWLLGFGWMALIGLRYGVWFLAILAPVTAQLLAPLVGRWLDRQNRGYPAVDITFASILLLLPLLALPGLREKWWGQAPPVLTSDTPVEAVIWLRTQPRLPGPIWHDLTFSSYLIFALPERPVWVDTRFELYPLQHWERYTAIAEAAPGWQASLDEDKIGLLILSPGRQARLVTALQGAPAWQEVYHDDTAIIFSR